MKILGITGGSGSGKTTLLDRIAKKGGTVVDCDAIYHRLLTQEPGLLEQLQQRFGAVVEDGALNRKKLGKLVFEDARALQDLNAIAHHWVMQAVVAELEAAKQANCPLLAIDAIALHESGLGNLCHKTVAVQAPQAQRIRRLMAREGIDEAYAKSRIAAQKSDEDFARRCDVTLVNDGALEEFCARCDALIETMLGGTIDE